MLDRSKAAELAAVLDWYRDMGVDEAVGETPIDWLQRGDVAPGHGFAPCCRRRLPPAPAARRASRPRRRAAPRHRPLRAARRRRAAPLPRHAAPVPGDGAGCGRHGRAQRPRGRRQPSTSWARRSPRFDGCSLKATAKNLCFYRGAPKARLMLIGEAPGRDEDLEGKPFVGRAGQLLDKMLAAIGLAEQDVHITNIVYWRPPGNRTPTPQEAQVCRPFLERQVELVAPEIVVLLGGAAAKHMLDVAEGIMRIRGKWREIEIGSVKVRAIATLHPAYLLRTPAAKRLAWRDLLAVKAALGG